jgi:3-phenylpropionate/trans-cinnamate dioxygenase ferredoxin reductase subunit
VNGIGKVVVVGAGIAGVRVAESLRQLGHRGEILVVSDEEELPYDRPPLSKDVLRGDTAPPVLLAEDRYREVGVELRLGTRAVALAGATHTVQFADGSAETGDVVVLTTGASARTLRLGADGAEVQVPRTAGDARRLRAALAQRGRLLVIGGGLIGCEVAASARARGVDVTVVEPLDGPCIRVLGPSLARRLAEMHGQQGVDIRTGAAVESLSAAPTSGVRAHLSDRTEIDADHVVVAVGDAPTVAWLDGSGVEVSDGIVCDHRGRTRVPGVYATGDVARWTYEPGGVRRTEH